MSTIGLERKMAWQPSTGSVYDKSKFKHYVTSEYKQSQRSETDEAYGMFEFNLLHIDSGLRLTLTTTESYYNETVEYNVIRMFIITSGNKELTAEDVNFKKEMFYTKDFEIPFAETNKAI